METQQWKAEQQSNLARADQQQEEDDDDEEEEEEEEQSMKKKIRQIWNQEHHKENDDGGLFSPRAASSSPSQECNASSGDMAEMESCTTPNPSSSKSQVILSFKKMKKDVDLLRRKATEAFSEQEWDARLSLVQEKEKRLELLMNEPAIIAEWLMMIICSAQY